MIPPVRNVRVRSATEDDAAAVTALVRAARLNPRALGWRRFVVAETLPDRQGRGAEVVGAAQLRDRGPGTREVASLVVHPRLRGGGVASRLLDRLLADAASDDLYALVDDAHADRWYHRGFVRVPPSGLPARLRRELRVARLFTAVLGPLTGRRVRPVPLHRPAARPAAPRHHVLDQPGDARR